MTQSILLLGAGELGLGILESLASHPQLNDVRLAVLLRKETINSTVPAKQSTVRRIKTLGASLEAGDVTTTLVGELASVLRNYDTVVCCTGMGLPPGTQERITKAVLEARVKTYVPWQFGMDYDVIGQGSSQDLFDEQLRVRKMVRSQAETKWIIFSTGVFMSFVFEPVFGVVDFKTRTARALGSWDTRITSTAVEDIGQVMSDVLLSPGSLGSDFSGILHVAGDTFTYEELADALDARFGPPAFQRELWDGDALKKQVEEDVPAAKYRETFGHGRGVAWEVTKTINHQRGLQMLDLKAYLVKHGEKLIG